jgi:para-aminobenzoate synthetase component 1
LQVYADLLKKSPVPFGAFVKSNGCYLMCASPERFLKKTGNRMLSQPIKGTSKRGVNEAEDIALKQALLNSEKERAENLMIVDLVRNDLARSAKTGTVKVEELFGIYSFEQVHQMISTVSATLADGIHWVDALKYAFPMGSMTGAPKISAMHLIEQYERTARGLYSGAVGYITPEGDFDFNVVIRSLQYNSINQFLNFEVGGAITYDSIPEKEYEECLIKAGAILDTLSSLSN